MRITLKKIFLFFILTIWIPLLSQESTHKWQRISGIWKVENSHAYETQARSVSWNYYELSNINSILSLKPFTDYTSIDLTMNISDRVESPAEIMISFNITSESQSWYYHLYAFKLSGGYWGMNKASFIYSDRIDKSKPLNTKNNTLVNELSSAECKIKYNRDYNYRVEFEAENVVLYIDGNKILSSPFPEKKHDGRIAISSRNVKIAVDKVLIKKGDKIIFEDDFNENSIYVKTLKATKEIIPKPETEK